MNKELQELATLYVLDALEGEELRAFEAELQASSELQRTVDELADGLHASMCPAFQLGEGPDAKVLDAIRQRVAAGPVSNAKRNPFIPSISWSTLWAAAALLMLGFNLFLLFNPVDEELLDGTQQRVGRTAAAEPAVSQAAVASSEADVYASLIERLEQEVASREEELEAKTAELKQITEGLQLVVNENDNAREAYARLASRFFPFYENREGISRFTVIEMADAGPQAAASRRPFVDLAEQFLTGTTNNIGKSSPMLLAGPMPEAGDLGETADGSRGLIAASLSEAGQAEQATADRERAASDQLFDGLATGFTVWRDDDQKGFIDIYNLPDPGPDREAYLWVKAGEMDPYVPVGALPSMEAGTGSLFYSVDQPDFTPTEVLITAEPVGGESVEPNPDGVLLRGP